MADETPEVTEAAAAEEQVKAAPAKGKAAPEPEPATVTGPDPVLEPEPAAEPGPDRMSVKMANAANGATFPGDVIEVDAEQGWALIRSGEASPA